MTRAKAQYEQHPPPSRDRSMPLSKYDKQFGGKGGASKAMAAMKETYGAAKGEQVFYATKNKKANKRKTKKKFKI